jgi:hypothetical protein
MGVSVILGKQLIASDFVLQSSDVSLKSVQCAFLLYLPPAHHLQFSSEVVCDCFCPEVIYVLTG